MSEEEKTIRKANADDDPPSTGGVNHTPIIITDGSASLEFTIASYDPDPESNVNTANEPLHLVSIVSDRPHTPGQQDRTCFNFTGTDMFEIEVKCKGGGGFNDFEIRGSFDPSIRPEVEVDRGEYRENGSFPPRHPPTGHRFVSTGRQITKLRIFRLINGHRQQPPVHDCPLVATPGNGWTVHDDHP
jgi:hypothetical protein